MSSSSSLSASFAGLRAIVTGGSGFVGRRLCELLAERGASHVLALDIAPPPPATTLTHPSHSVIENRSCDITDAEAVMSAMQPADCVWHTAGLVGPFHARHAYEAVNHRGTLHVIAACKHHGIGKLIYCSSPSTRFDGSDVSGRTEAELSIRPPGGFLEPYAEAKARGEVAVREALDVEGGFLTCSIAPHQVYGPRDPIFLPNLMDAARLGKLRVFGRGENRVSMVHVDNFCHGMILGYHALASEETASAVAGEFIVVTDGGSVNFWCVLDQAAIFLGYGSFLAKMHLPVTLLYALAYAGVVIGKLTGRSFKLTPFTVKMLTIDRWFKIDKAKKLLNYSPLVSFEEGWADTLQWFKENSEYLEVQSKKTKENKVFETKKDS